MGNVIGGLIGIPRFHGFVRSKVVIGFSNRLNNLQMLADGVRDGKLQEPVNCNRLLYLKIFELSSIIEKSSTMTASFAVISVS